MPTSATPETPQQAEPPEPAAPAVAPPVHRRTVLAGGAALGAAVLATACAATPATPAPPAGSGSSGTPVGPASEVPVGGGRVFEALEVVVTQPVAGEFRGFSAVCTHTGCIVTSVTDGTINCPCHGSRFGLDGALVAGPAPRPLRERPVTVTDGQIILA
ncbi:MAG: Rieske (2Fe-2S) protein [Pseudonocardia sp.]